MSPELIDLGRRAVACKGWRWMPGMRVMVRFRDHPCAEISEAERTDLRIDCDRVSDYLYGLQWMGMSHTEHDPIPDLSDPCTVGGMTSLVRQSHSDQIVISQGQQWWMIESEHGEWGDGDGMTFVEGLVCALEAAP